MIEVLQIYINCKDENANDIRIYEVGDKVNLERSMLMNGRLDGHIVQGHVDQTAKCIEIREVADVEYIPLEAVSSSLLINDIWGYYVFYLSK